MLCRDKRNGGDCVPLASRWSHPCLPRSGGEFWPFRHAVVGRFSCTSAGGSESWLERCLCCGHCACSWTRGPGVSRWGHLARCWLCLPCSFPVRPERTPPLIPTRIQLGSTSSTGIDSSLSSSRRCLFHVSPALRLPRSWCALLPLPVFELLPASHPCLLTLSRPGPFCFRHPSHGTPFTLRPGCLPLLPARSYLWSCGRKQATLL